MPSTFEQQQEALRDCQDAALAWWESHRPAAWNVRRHLDNPKINTGSTAEAFLAESIAAAVEIGAL
ncbi:MAG: hypothetical protein JO253_03345 [Alphaproteobacteria bacterium]|nr:hypothetical protein [Alphaproteobacteria bacterium]